MHLTSQLSCDRKTGKIIRESIELQTKNALENVKQLLENSDSSLKNVLKAVVYLRNLDDFDKMNKVHRLYFKDGEEPARVTVQAAAPINGIDLEIEVAATVN